MNPQEIQIADYVYDLPDDRIARHPLAVRDSCKLLVANSKGVIDDTVFTALPELLPAEAMLVYNNTRVINARVILHKATGAAIEIFCLEPVSPADYERMFASTGPVVWRCLVGNSKRWKEGTLSRVLDIPGVGAVTMHAVRKAREEGGASSLIEFSWDNPACRRAQVSAAAGVIPMPPYLSRETEACDSEDYQTIFSRIEGSVAAPTAGLHFTDRVLADIDARGIRRREVTLHVGAGTFRPVQGDCVGEHTMHAEFIVVSRSLIEELANEENVYAVGTTSVRTLESLYHIGCLISQGRWEGEVPQWYPYDPSHPNLSPRDALTVLADYLRKNGMDSLIGSTRIIIAPGYQYRIVHGMVTNFHQPGSTLLLLVSALLGDAWRDVYAYALAHGYRFLSYGDACLFTH